MVSKEAGQFGLLLIPVIFPNSIRSKSPIGIETDPTARLSSTAQKAAVITQTIGEILNFITSPFKIID
jgi:hypothetical protein